jgi:hypothetical protein
LVLKYLQLKSTFSRSLSTLAALLRQQLFFYRDPWAWLDDPFQAPPAPAGVHDDAQQLAIAWYAAVGQQKKWISEATFDFRAVM